MPNYSSKNNNTIIIIKIYIKKKMLAYALQELSVNFALVSSAYCLSRYGPSGKDIKPPSGE